MQAQFNQVQESYRHLQADYTRKSQALAQLTGATQQPPPVQDQVTQLANQIAREHNINVEDAKIMASMQMKIQQASEQRIGAIQQAMMAQNAVPGALQQAYAQAPQLFSDPSLVAEVQRALVEDAQRGYAQIDANYAIDVAAIINTRRQIAGVRQQQFVPQLQQLPPGAMQFPGQFGFTNLAPQQHAPVQQTTELSPELKAENERVRAAYGLGQTPNQ